jgi:DNA-binding FrmR family transcriptional regulator
MPNDTSGHDLHQHHVEISKRLRRADGHLQSVIQMIHDKRDCLEIAQQLHAVEKAIGQAKKTLIQDHLDHCLEEAIGSVSRDQRGPIDAFKAITKYL